MNVIEEKSSSIYICCMVDIWCVCVVFSFAADLIMDLLRKTGLSQLRTLHCMTLSAFCLHMNEEEHIGTYRRTPEKGTARWVQTSWGA